jgi:thiamine-phosphate pyrophosphorylase
VLLCYVTDRKQFQGDESYRHERLLHCIREAATAGIDFIQLREKDLSACELESLATRALQVVRASGTATRLLINSRIDVAIAAGTDGVHLPATDVSPAEARTIFHQSGFHNPIVAASCHEISEVRFAESSGADFALFGPVFEKQGRSGSGLQELRKAATRTSTAGAHMPVLAIGGITLDNAAACVQAGADGIAAIRLFQQGDLAFIIRSLREIPAAKPLIAKRHPYLPS